MRTTARTAAVVVAAVLLVAGCSGGGDDESPSSGGADAGTSASGDSGLGEAEAPTEDGTVGEDEAPASAAELPSEPVAVAPGLVDGMVLEVYGLTRSGDVVTLTLGVLNEGEEEVSPVGRFGSRVGDLTVSGISLLDLVNLNRHMVLRDTEDNCLCSSFVGAGNIAPGARFHLTASFPAPPEDVTAMTVDTPSGTLVDVPITEES